MHASRFAVVALVAVGGLAAITRPASAQAADTSSQRPTEVRLIMGNSRRYAGTYQAGGMSRICGYGPLRDMAGFVEGFTLMFPDGEDIEIVDINFSADTLAAGSTTKSFYISISLKAKQGGRPPGYVVRANEPRFKETGTATLTVTGGTATLRVVGTNDIGETMDMTAVCGPQQKTPQ